MYADEFRFWQFMIRLIFLSSNIVQVGGHFSLDVCQVGRDGQECGDGDDDDDDLQEIAVGQENGPVKQLNKITFPS